MFLYDVPNGAIVCFNGSAVYWMKVTDDDGLWGVVNLNKGIVVGAKALRERYGLDPNHFSLVASTLNEIMYEED